MPIDPEATFIPLLYDSCTYLDVSDLGDANECQGCFQNFGWKADSETPVQLRCGHIYGLSCIRQVVHNHVHLQQRYPPCPYCRADFLNVSADTPPVPVQQPQVQSRAQLYLQNRPRLQVQNDEQPPLENQRQPQGPTQGQPQVERQRQPQVQGQPPSTVQYPPIPIPSSNAAQSRQDAGIRPPGTLFSRAIESRRQAASRPVEEQIDTWVQSLRNLRTFGGPVTQDQKQWIRRTEHLWLAVYDAALASPDAQVVDALVDCTSIYGIYQNCNSRHMDVVGRATRHIRDLETRIPRPWSALMEHMDQAGSIGIDDEGLSTLFVDRYFRHQWLDERKARLRSYRGY